MSVGYVVLGVVGARRAGEAINIGGPRQRRLLGALLLDRGRCVSADRLVEVVWSGRPPGQARNTLRTYIARLRRSLEVNGSEPLITEPTGWRLEVAEGAVDSGLFESQLAAAQAMATDPISALGVLDEALGLWRGDAYVEFADEEWFLGEAVRLNELRLVAEEDRFEAMLDCGLHDEVISDVGRFIEANTLREQPRAQQMIALYKAGRQVEALRAFQDYRRQLGNEVGVEPSQELRALEQRIVMRDPGLSVSKPAGRVLRGYRLGHRIGDGRFGVVYRASQPSIGREVAVKVVRPELADDAAFIRRFEREAQIVASLDHAHIVPLFDYWREPGGAYLVMRYLRGGSLADSLERGKPLSLSFASQLVEQIGGALVAAHQAGVVHRDVRPGNILFDEHGSAYLTDFGIATRPGEPGEAGLSSTGCVIYAGPEGSANGSESVAADVYALGAVLYEVLAGAAPFDPVTPNDVVVETKRRGPIGPLAAVRSGMPADLDAVIQRATDPDPTRRFVTMVDMVLAFRAATSADQSGDTVAPNIVAPVPRNPYKGLTAFDEADSRDFFGRDELVDQICAAVRQSRFVTLVGASGSGKSSVIHAGVAPALRSDECVVVSMTPGAAPMAALESALLAISIAPMPDRSQLDRDDVGVILEMVDRCIPGDIADVVLIIDQFEELFTQTPDDSRDRFLQALTTAATNERTRLRVVTTLRADFYDRPLGHRVASRLMRDNTIAVTPLSTHELERSIVGPAERVGIQIERELIVELVTDATGDPASLPMLQYALTSLFDASDERVLTADTYRGLGGIAGAVARRADELYAQANDEDQAGIRRLFTRLTDQEPGSPVVRRRARRSELTAVSDSVIERYADARLLFVDRDVETREPTVEVAHESLVNSWPKFRRWLDDDADGLRILRHLTRTAETWSRAGRDDDELYRGGHLDAAEEWTASNPADVNELERAFLQASLDMRERLDAEEQARSAQEARIEHRASRRARILVVVVVAGFVAAGALATWAIREGSDADRKADLALARELIEQSGATLPSDAELAVLLALEATDLAGSSAPDALPDAERALRASLEQMRTTAVAPGLVMASGADGDVLVTIDENDRLSVRRGGIEAPPTEYPDPAVTDPGAVLGPTLAVSNDGSVIAYTPEPKSPIVIDVATGAEIATLIGHNAAVTSIAISDDGTRAITSSLDGNVILWNATTGREIRRISTDSLGGSFSPDGDSVAFGSHSDATGNGSIVVWDADTGADVFTRCCHRGSILAASFGAHGRTLASIGFGNRRLLVWDIQDGSELWSRIDPSGRFSAVAVAPDGGTIATGSVSGVVRLWDTATGDNTMELGGHSAEITHLAFVSGGSALYSSSLDGTTRLWNVGTTRLDDIEFSAHLIAEEFAPDGSVIATAESDGVLLWENASGDALHLLEDAGEVAAMQFSPDSRLLATAGEFLTIWDVGTGERLTTLEGHDGMVLSVDFSLDGRELVSGGFDHLAKIWDVESGVESKTLPEHPGSVWGVAWNADGTIATVSEFGGVRLHFRDSEDLERIARERVTRSLTDAECQRYLRADRCPG